MRDFYENDDANWELNHRIERDEEREQRPPIVLRPRRNQLRYWSGQMFRPVRQARTRPNSARSAHPPELFS